MEEPPELVKTMLEFMSKGVIPEDIDDKAMDLILMSDMYGLDLLTVACATSMVENLSPENVESSSNETLSSYSRKIMKIVRSVIKEELAWLLP